jgi:predicted DNA repair protein MutK
MSAGFLALLKQMALMSEKAAIKTVGVVGDDLAISANQLIGGQSERKLPMVMKVVKGSLKNKAILIPCALALSFTFPAAIAPALTIGGALLCFDSVDKIVHKKLKPLKQKSEAEDNDHDAWEKRHIKRALKTDLLLSAEITTVSLGVVVGMPFLVQLGAMAVAGLTMTAAVYGVVTGIIKMDDTGAALTKAPGTNLLSKAARSIGKTIVHAAPKLIKVIGVAGTAAMFFVGGGMLVHGIPGGEQLMAAGLNAITSNSLLQGALAVVGEAALGLAAGFAAIPVARVVVPPCRNVMDFCKGLINKVRNQLPEPADDPDEIPAPEASPNALKGAPDLKTELNNAAKAPANENHPATVTAKAPPASKKPGA